ncbi:MAG: hypothetical protein EB053_07055 [Chlamydiae bacterium]|nr:hypothetical protein [Chlamydiota bacterium]
MAFVLSKIKKFVVDNFITNSMNEDGIVRAIVNRTRKQVFKIKKTDNIFEAIDAAFKAYPEWSKTDDIRFNACSI